MAKKLKLWNGRGHGKLKRLHLSVAAYSQKQAAELVNLACDSFVTTTEIREYYSPCWGNNMRGVEPTEPCVYAEERIGGEPKLIYPPQRKKGDE